MQLGLFLDETSTVPIYKQVADGIEQRILAGELERGSKLPSTRELAEFLVVSRCTASKAYELLEFRGFITSLPQVGTFVSMGVEDASWKHRDAYGGLPVWPAETSALQPLSQYGAHIMSCKAIESADVELHPELNFFAPAVDHLPLAKWQEMILRATRTRAVDPSRYRADPLGSETLRRALAAYVLRTRGIRCNYEQIALFSGAQAALDLISRLVLNPGDEAAVEDPGFPGVRRTFKAHGAAVCTIPVDKHGILVSELARLARGSRVAYVTPAHHDPTGVVLSPQRREQLLNWAETSQALVIEDDFDCEYRYTDKPLPALYAADTGGCVVYLSSFWKVMFPVVQVGFVIVPPRLLPAVKRAKSLIERDFHFVEHEALAHFINEGHLERHIRKTKAVYARRRLELISQLNSHLGSRVKISPVSGGTHLLVQLDTGYSDDSLLQMAAESGLPMVSTHTYYAGDAVPGEMLIPFAHMEQEEIAAVVERFSSLL